MTDLPFQTTRRQQFLTEVNYKATRQNQLDLLAVEEENFAETEPGSLYHQNASLMLFLESLWLWMLDYTAGVELPILARQVSGLVDRFEVWNLEYQDYLRFLHHDNPEDGNDEYLAAPDFDLLADYENLLQLVSIAILVRDIGSVERVIYIMRSHRGEDGLLETLFESYENSEELNSLDCVIAEPYQFLLKAFRAPNPTEALAELKRYLTRWYHAMKKQTRWHDAHLRQKEGKIGSYYGYWSFEAAAVAYLLELDATDADNIVFPHDLLNYANEMRETEQFTSKGKLFQEAERLTAKGGSAAPQSGFWETPGELQSRRYFEKDEILPVLTSDFGQTIWQWSSDQKAS